MNRSIKQAGMYLLVPCLFLVILYGIYKMTGVSIENHVISQLYMAIEKGSPDYNQVGLQTDKEDAQKETSLKDEKKKPKQDWIKKSEVQIPVVGERYARVNCESIGLDAFLYFGDTKEILKHGIGQYEKSSLPGFGSTILVCGNHHTYMQPLVDVKEKQIITITTEYGIYQYKVRETKVVNEAEISEEIYQLDSKEEQLILYTSYPFDEIVTNKKQQFFVYCDKIAGLQVKEGK